MPPIKTKNGTKRHQIDNNHIIFSPHQLSPIYNQAKSKRTKICQFLKEKAQSSKKTIESEGEKQTEVSYIIIPQEKYVNTLRRHADEIHVPALSKSIENQILKLVPKQMRQKFPRVVADIMSECKDEWNVNLHSLTVKTIVRDVTGKDRIPYVEKPFQCGGKTENYEHFTKLKKHLDERLLMTQPLIRKIISHSVKSLPAHLVQFDAYNKHHGYMGTTGMSQLFFDDLKQSEMLITDSWFPRVLTFYQRSKSIKTLAPKKLHSVLRCASKLVAVQIVQLMRRSIECIISTVDDDEKMPLVNIVVKLNDTIVLEPTYEEVCEMFCDFLKGITSICKSLPSLDSLVDAAAAASENAFIDIHFNELVFDEYIQKLKEILKRRFEPIKIYIENLAIEYGELLHTDGAFQIIEFNEEVYSIAYEKIWNYRKIRGKLSSIVNNEYFKGMKLSLEDIVNSLKNVSFHLENTILTNLCNLHEKESRDICNEFETIAKMALTEPKDAAELIAIGQYCMRAKTVLIEELKERISKSIIIMSRLIELTLFTDEHIEVNTKMINWVNEIAPILETSAQNYEITKYDMEEALLAKTNSLTKKVLDIYPYLNILDEMDDINNTLPYLEDLRRLVHWINDCEKDLEWINAEETTFKFPVSQYTELEELKNYVYPFYELMYLLHKWRRSFFCWMDGPFEHIDNVQVESQHESYLKEFHKIFKDYKNKIKQQIAENKERRFKGLAEDPDPMNLPAPMKLCSQAIKELNDWKPCVQLVNIMCNPALKQRHWNEMSKIAKFDLTPNAGTTIRKIKNFDLWQDLHHYEIISMGACKELNLIKNLEAMMDEWKDINFEFGKSKVHEKTVLVKLDTIQTIVDEHTMKTIGMRGSPFVKPFEEKVKKWYNTLFTINSSIEEWGKVQYKWLYFLPLMSSASIISQMPQENAMFQEVDKTYAKYINAAQKNPSVVGQAGGPELLNAMIVANHLLDKINDGVNQYIEKKRLFFPRFFFLSTDEILEILSETSDPTKVRPHLKKCFEGIEDLEFDSDLNILGMMSKQGERVDFLRKISTADAKGSVEKWLVEVEIEMLKTIHNRIKMSHAQYDKVKRTDWIMAWEGMVILCVSQIYWAISVHECFIDFRKEKLEKFYLTLADKLNELVNLIRSPNLTNVMRISIKALIVIDVHAKDIVQELIERNVHEDTDFNWLAQLRYYWEDENVKVKIINATVKYAYEYLGNSDRLVITPLTDRCYRTLIGAYSLHLNGAPEGPAGTGKTETTKDLAKALAIQCIVFNCSEGLDYKSMGRFFKGLASTGAWACFDEFNRIDAEVLSVVAQQILVIVQAVRQKLTKFNFEGTQLTLNPTCYVCITMNPGYAGRSELPDNLKALFRTIAMMVPDYAMIGEIFLYSYGFLDARNLAVKIVTVYRLLSEQLSSQKHYDYGMRAVKAVLSACGNNKVLFPEENEEVLLLRALRDVNLSKFLNFDIPLFEAIISDVFPNVHLATSGNEKFLSLVYDAGKRMHLDITDYFLSKIDQTNQMLKVRHGVMLIGDPLSGKSSVLKVLFDVLCVENDLGSDSECLIINPKAMHIDILYGAFDKITNEWFDGIVGLNFRKFSRESGRGLKWIIFDGPVDALWIENMNTVLDDSKKLCLMSGEVMGMSDGMSVLFETMDLSQASPATVSRCGMIYLESCELGYEPFVKSWLESTTSAWKTGNEKLILDLCTWLFPPVMAFLKKIKRSEITAGNINLVLTTLQVISMLMDEAVSIEEDAKYLKTWIQASFIFGIIWGFGGNLSSSSKAKFDEHFRELLKNEESQLEGMEKLDVSIPFEGLLCDYIYQYKQKGVWKSWSEIMKMTKIPETKNTPELLIPTVDSLKFMYIIDMHIKYNKPFAFIGPTGTGKTFYIRDYIVNKLSIDKFTPSTFTLTTTITARATQEILISKLQKMKKRKYGPGKGKRAVVFIDDVSMPAKEFYGAQPPIELLRQFLDHGYVYDPISLSKVTLVDVLLLTSMGLVGGNRQLVCPRFLRHFCLYYLDEFPEETMHRIFSNTLQIGLRKNGFGNETTPFISSAVNGSLNIYTTIKEHLLPTVACPHYTFNLRDVCRVVQGCVMVKKECLKDDNKKILIRLWMHETLRVFADRLICDEDRTWFIKLLIKNVEEHFKENLSSVCDNQTNSDECLNTIMFGAYLGGDSIDDERNYVEVPDVETLLIRATDALAEYNTVNKRKLDLVLFQYALEHLSKICRIFTLPGGCALLVGTSGSGKQSLTRLASVMMGYSIFQPEITKDYDINAWRDDFKHILKVAGGKAKDIIFLLDSNQIIDEVFLQNIDSFLNSGEVPNLFNFEEQQEILELVRLAAQGGNRNLDISPIQVMSFFTAMCKAKLHTCVCLSPVGSAFRERIRLYPTLVDCCTIDWFDPWPEDALQKIAETHMETVNVENVVKENAIRLCKYFYVHMQAESMSHYERTRKTIYITSGGYLSLINMFILLMNEKQKELSLAKQRYINGLEKLNKAAEAVAQMQGELNELKPQLIIMADKGTEMMEEIERETIEADKATVQVREDEKIANEQAAASQELKKDCEADLALAIPILEDAIAALNTLKPTDITLVKSMKNPPAPVKLVMAAVCVMKSIPPDRIPDPNNPGRKMHDFWGPSKRLLGDMAFLQNLKEYDKDNIPPTIMAKIRKEYLPHKDFKPATIAKASTAAEGLCKWVIAMDMYDAVAKVVAPKKAKLQAAEDAFAATMAILEEKKAMVARLEKKLADLNMALEEANLKKRQLEDEVDHCVNKLFRAEKLLGGLGGEKSRWTNSAENLQNAYDNLAGDILISCGFIAYLTPFPASIRNSALVNWNEKAKELELPLSENFILSKVLGNEIKIQQWYISGLPRDQISTDNAIIQDISLRWSLFIDPQGQANKWIKTMEEKNELKVTKLSDSNFMTTLQTCMSQGKPALIENVFEILPAPLNPILKKNTYFINEKEFISLGGDDVEYNRNFRLYITTKLRSPNYTPEVYNIVTLINFALSIDGLEDQLLGIVVAKERPDLQEKREQLIIESAQNTAELRNLERNILKTLQESKGDILEDEAAIEVLDASKLLSNEIRKRNIAAKETELTIEEFRKTYRPIAAYCAHLYYCVTDLPNINVMYQFSLVWFINLYVYSIRTANKSNNLKKRLQYLNQKFTYTLYSNVCRSLFAKDKLMFSFVLCCKMLAVNNEIGPRDLNFLITRNLRAEDSDKNTLKWLPDKSWNEICAISESLENFKSFKSSVSENDAPWKNIYDSLEPQNEPLPPPWNENISQFEKLLVIKVIRPDKILNAIAIFIERYMGKQFISPPPFDIKKSFNESNCLVPMLFVLSPGSDPISYLMKFSENMGYEKKLAMLSLGQDQGVIAKAMLEQAQADGSWVCLQNCHLAPSWLPELDNIVESLNLSNTDLNFRLWLTAYPSDVIPQSLLFSSVKMTNEPPVGLKNNIIRSYNSEMIKEPSFYGGCPDKYVAFTKFIYCVSFFHAVIQERKKFGALGWNIPYGFDDSDFSISIMQLQVFLNQYEHIPYVALSYLIGECNYGGRVTDDWDRRLIVTILNDFINPSVVDDPDYAFFKNHHKYSLPVRFEYQDYLRHIDSLPESSTPNVLGLNTNAGIFCDYNDSMSLLDSLAVLQEHSVAESSLDNCDAVCKEILAKLPPPFDVEEAKIKYPFDYEESMNVFLVQEMERYNKLVSTIELSLRNVQKGLKGIIVITPDIETDANYLRCGKTPEKWKKVSYPSLKPLGSYITDLLHRLEMIGDWHRDGKPHSFWISGFFFTQAFLTGEMQNYARRNKIPIDLLTFDCEISDVNQKKGGFYVYGAFTDGARWNAEMGILDEQLPKVLNEPMPTIRIYAVLKREFAEGSRYKCPVYKTVERRGIISTTGHSTNFVMPLMIPSNMPSSHWIKRSTALLLQLSD